MTQSIQHICGARLQDLPSELITQIVHEIPGFSALHNFVVAYPLVVDIIVRAQERIFIDILEADRTPLQIRKLISTIIAFRNDYSADYLPTEAFFHHYLEEGSCTVRMATCRDPIKMLRYIAWISEDVQFYAGSIAQKRILDPSEYHSTPISENESYLITRAIWRFLLCYELAHPYTSDTVHYSDDSKVAERWNRRYFFYENHTTLQPEQQGWLTCTGRPPSYCLDQFLRTIRAWEIDEIESIRFHLRSEVNTFQYNRTTNSTNDLSTQPFLLQRLLTDLNHWRSGPDASLDHVLVGNLRQPNVTMHMWPIVGPTMPMLSSYDAYYESLYTIEHQNDHKWGWQLWDSSRLRYRHLYRPHYYLQSMDLDGLTHFEILQKMKHIKCVCETAQRTCYEAQFSEIDRTIKARYSQYADKKRQEFERAKHMRQKGWLLKWIEHRYPGLYNEWRDLCETAMFDSETRLQAEKCYFRAKTFKSTGRVFENVW
ncbi:hypothetical protein N7G274_002762 [Stereocaulon virgatum]|uniref:F-box domain-containing protein n=1 Tax=Stereocaulon virgatum TaxID=373712 RepID=A0ABR4AJZ1_9LECA